MKHISRNIWVNHDVTNGELYLYRTMKRTEAIFLTKEMAEEYRLEKDFEKPVWKCYTLECWDVIPEDVEFKSSLRVDKTTGKWYAQVKIKDDIIVSDLYSSKNEIKQVREYLDKERWSVRALNHQKRDHISSTRKYSGILPTKQGYLLLDSKGEEYGLFDDIKEAISERDMLRSRGVLI